jgi:hypothetical protein
MFIKLHYFPQADEPLVTKCAGFNAWTPGARHYSLSAVTQADSRNRLSTLLRQSPFRLPIATGLPCTSPKDANFRGASSCEMDGMQVVQRTGIQNPQKKPRTMQQILPFQRRKPIQIKINL